jgi:hypothetical protein
MVQKKTEPSPERPAKKTCFVVAEFGSTPEARKRSQQTLHHLVRKVLEPRGYDVVRADEIRTPGLITHQVINRLLDDDLVVADLTGHNPNVFYEMAVRHAAARPIIHILTDGEVIPFDVKDVRTVLYALDDPDRLEEARQQLESAVTEIEKSPDEDTKNPISVVRRFRLLEASGDPGTVEIGEVLAAVANLRDEVRSLGDQVWPRITAPTGQGPSRLIERAANALKPRIWQIVNNTSRLLSTEDIIERLNAASGGKYSEDVLEQVLEHMSREGTLSWLDDERGAGWSAVPF